MSDVYDLLERAEELPYGPERLALVEQAVRQADLSRNIVAGYDARKELITSALYAGHSEKMLVAFAWCRTYLDQTYLDEHSPTATHWEERSLMWSHKWVLTSLYSFPQVPLARIEELYADYERRLRALGKGLRTIPYFRLHLAMHLGDTAGAQMAFNLWQFTKRDDLSDCLACEAQTIADYHEFIGDYEGSVRQV